jgi:hypothetical protein
MRRIWIATPLALVLVLGATTGCGATPASPGTDPSAAGVLGTPGASGEPTAAPTSAGPGPGAGTTAAPPPAQWPSPLDCISYEPTALTKVYAAGVWSIKQGSNEIARVYGGPSENMGDKLLALAKRYRQVCFIGRGNFRDEKEAYIFEYWRNPSGINSPIPDSADDCSSYDRNNLQVNDMGGGYGWRVKDDDHVLQIFDTEADAINGRIVLSKYNQICYVQSETMDGVSASITYS